MMAFGKEAGRNYLVLGLLVVYTDQQKPLVADEEASIRFEHKKELRQKNLAAFTSRPDPSTFKNLDGSIKKNTSFIKKIRTALTNENLPNLIKDVTTLKLEKYLSEIVTAISEVKFKSSADVWAAVEVCSLLHQRFADFSKPLVNALTKQLGPPPSTRDLTPEQKEKEETARLTRQRSALRLLGELYVVGIATDTPEYKEGLMPGIARQLFLTDRDLHANLPLAVAFTKNFGEQFFGKVAKGRGRRGSVSSANEKEDSPGRGDESDVPSGSEAVRTPRSLVEKEVQDAIKALMVEYFKSVAKHLVRDHERIRKMEKRNHEHYIARGEITEDRQERYEKDLKAYEKLLASTQTLAEYLEQEMPDLPEDESMTRLGIGIVEGGKEILEKDPNSGPWEDEDAKAFYENVVDLRNFVPAVILGVTKDQISEKEEAAKKEPSPAPEEPNDDLDIVVPADEELEDGEETVGDRGDAEDLNEDDTSPLEPEPALIEEDEEEEEKGKSLPSTDRVALENLLTRLPNALNREAIDQIAVEFAFLNSKGARTKLVKALLAVPRQRLDMLPYYARLVGTLQPYIPEIGTKLVDALEHIFHAHQKRKNQIYIEEKIKNVRYIGELTKFRVTPNHVIFHCLKVLLENFKHHNIELACQLLETCGRFLYKTPETSTRTANYLDILVRKKKLKFVDNRQALMIENAYYQCNPPDRPAVLEKPRKPIELYMRKLIYADLSKKTVEKILKQFRKMNWEDPDIRRMIAKLFHKMWKVKFSHLHLMAFLASELSRYYPKFGIGIVDNTLEEIRSGMEHNIFKHNQRRVATVKFLGELYNYRMVDSQVIFDTLYLLVRFGHENGIPRPDVCSPLDAPHDFFRVRLVCTLLDTCGQCFDRGSAATRLDQFLIFLQMYIFAKIKPPMDIDFLVAETFELLRPKLPMLASYEQAVEEVNRIAKEQMEAVQNGTNANGMEENEDSEDDEDDEDGEGGGKQRRQNGREDGASDDEENGARDGTEQNDEEEGTMLVNPDEDAVVVHVHEDTFDDGDDEDFEAEFSRLMQESIESRKNERKPAMFDVAIPHRSRSAGATSGDEEESGQVSFTLLTKKGSKQQTKTMALPADSAFVRSSRSKQEAEQEEKLQLKKLVLNYEEREREAIAGKSGSASGSSIPQGENGLHGVILSEVVAPEEGTRVGQEDVVSLMSVVEVGQL
ncbi:hypothetical protein HK104_009522, partial [Borealophlyctis nickersoniae]